VETSPAIVRRNFVIKSVRKRQKGCNALIEKKGGVINVVTDEPGGPLANFRRPCHGGKGKRGRTSSQPLSRGKREEGKEDIISNALKRFSHLVRGKNADPVKECTT